MASGELSALPSQMIVPPASITQTLVVFTETSKPTKHSIALLPDPLGWIGGA